MALRQEQKQKTVMALGQSQLQGLQLLAKSLPELRAEINAELERNPVIESIDHPLEMPLSEIERKHSDEAACAESQSDYPEDDTYSPVTSRSDDEEYLERRQKFFDNQVGEETLQQHLTAQLPLSDIAPGDYPLAEILIGDIDINGYYKGSMPDAAMVFQKPLEAVEDVLAKIREFDPPGCGSRTLEECFLSQLDLIDDIPLRLKLRRELSAPKADVKRLCEEDREVFAALKGLNGTPGRGFPNEKDRPQYVNPEITAVKRDGRWLPQMDERSVPEFHFSKQYLRILNDPNAKEEARAFVRERLESAKRLRESIENRQSTVGGIAAIVFECQQDFFEKGFAALKPLTETEVAKRLSVADTTVSRAVRDKYVATPRGTIELRRFFTSGVKTADGTTISQEAVLRELRRIVEGEDRTSPMSDEKLAAALAKRGFPVSRRAVTKYREKLDIPNTSKRRVRDL